MSGSLPLVHREGEIKKRDTKKERGRESGVDGGVEH
jgi:hypothetical protein